MKILDLQEFKAATGKRLSLMSVDAKGTCQNALTSMRAEKLHHLLVLQNHQYAGIVSERDLLSAIVAQPTATVSAAVQHELPKVDSDTPVLDVIRKMRQVNSAALPVEQHGEVYDIITMTDLIAYFESELAAAEVDDSGNISLVLANPLVQNIMKALSDVGI